MRRKKRKENKRGQKRRKEAILPSLKGNQEKGKKNTELQNIGMKLLGKKEPGRGKKLN